MLKRMRFVLGALALVALACAPGGGGAPTETAAGAPEAAACGAGQTDGDLALYNWTEYIDPELITQFEEEFGVSVTEDFYTSNEEMLAKLQAGATGFDVIVPSDYMVEIMAGQDLLLPVQEEAIPNAPNLDPQFLGAPFDPDNAFSLPYQWGTTGIGVNLDVVGDVPATWGLIFDPALSEQFAGQISMLDDSREVMGGALKYLGYSLNTTDEAQIQEAGELLASATPRIATFTSTGFGELLAGGETVVTHGWSGDIAAAMAESEASLGYLIPEEGGVVWVDNMAIPASADNPCTAHAFLNFILDAENGATLTNWTFYASPNQAAEPMILEEVLEDTSIYPPDEVMERLEFIEDVGDATTLYEDAFVQARS